MKTRSPHVLRVLLFLIHLCMALSDEDKDMFEVQCFKAQTNNRNVPDCLNYVHSFNFKTKPQFLVLKVKGSSIKQIVIKFIYS